MAVAKRILEQIGFSGKQNRFTKRNTYGPFEIDIVNESVTDRYQRKNRNLDAMMEFNSEVQAWGTKVRAAMVSSIKQMVDEDKRLSRTLKVNYYADRKRWTGDEEIDRIGFSFQPEGVYIHLGVGRGYHRESGQTVKRTKQNTFSSKQNTFGASKERTPKPWFNPVLEQHIGELDKIVSNYAEGLSINYMNILITS